MRYYIYLIWNWNDLENLNTVGENFIEFTKVIAAKAVQLDDIIDLALEPVKDYTDTLGDLAGPVKSTTPTRLIMVMK